MAESCTLAFGRYLKMLRERRGFSLEEVASRSRSLADPVEKGYLSRCENGRHGAGFSKIITLARVYEVPIEVLAERLELDMELDRIGGPDTSGLSYREMNLRGTDAGKRGKSWESYAFFRDASTASLPGEVMEGFRDLKEQALCAVMNTSTAAARLGRSRFALHELEYIQASNGLTPTFHAVLLERLATRYRALGHVSEAKRLCDASIADAEERGEVSYLGYLYSARGRVAEQEGNLSEAIRFFRRAEGAYRRANRESECAVVLQNIAYLYFRAGHNRSARRAVEAAERMAVGSGRERTRALARTLLGEIALADGHRPAAKRYWTEAIEIAKRLGDKILQFQAEFPMYRAAVDNGDEAVASSLERRLRRLSAWIPPDVEELKTFRVLSSTRSRRVPRSVAQRKRTP